MWKHKVMNWLSIRKNAWKLLACQEHWLSFPIVLTFFSLLWFWLSGEFMPWVCCPWAWPTLRSQAGFHFNDNFIYRSFSSATLHKSRWFTPRWLAHPLGFTKDICHTTPVQAARLNEGHVLHQLNLSVYNVTYAFSIQSHIHTNWFLPTIYIQ